MSTGFDRSSGEKENASGGWEALGGDGGESVLVVSDGSHDGGPFTSSDDTCRGYRDYRSLVRIVRQVPCLSSG